MPHTLFGFQAMWRVRTLARARYQVAAGARGHGALAAAPPDMLAAVWCQGKAYGKEGKATRLIVDEFRWRGRLSQNSEQIDDSVVFRNCHLNNSCIDGLQAAFMQAASWHSRIIADLRHLPGLSSPTSARPKAGPPPAMCHGAGQQRRGIAMRKQARLETRWRAGRRSIGRTTLRLIRANGPQLQDQRP